MVLRREVQDGHSGEGRSVVKWPATGTGGVQAATLRPGGSPNFAEVCNKAIARLDARLAAAVADAADASGRSCVYAAAGDLLRTFQWDAHATALGKNVKSLARTLTRWRQR